MVDDCVIEHPAGLLTGDVLKSFYAVTGDYPNFKYTPGYEKFPNNWYKRNPVDYYTIPYLSVDIDVMALEHPQFLSIGGNTGKVNTFTGVDPADLTGGVYNSGTLLEGNNLICYGLQLSLAEAPDLLSGLFSDITAATQQLGTAINNATNGLGCPELSNANQDQFKTKFANYPGFTTLKPDGTY